MTNFEWYYKEVTNYCIMKLGFENECTIDLFKMLDGFDEGLKIFFNFLDSKTVELILSKDKERIDKQAEYLSLEWKDLKQLLTKQKTSVIIKT